MNPASMNHPNKILIVGGTPEEQRAIRDNLSFDYRTVAVSSPADALSAVRAELPDLILLDASTHESERQIARASTWNAAVLFCSAIRASSDTANISTIILGNNGELSEKVKVFAAGADDFLQKPYDLAELRLRIQAVLRRVVKALASKELIRCGSLELDIRKWEARHQSSTLKLTSFEFQLLRFFLENPETVWSREQVIDSVWRGSHVTARTVDTHIKNLRKKLPPFGFQLETVYKVGYVLRKTPAIAPRPRRARPLPGRPLTGL